MFANFIRRPETLNNNNIGTRHDRPMPAHPAMAPAQSQNTPPASEREIASLTMVKITVDDLQEESNKECLICLEEHQLGLSVS